MQRVRHYRAKPRPVEIRDGDYVKALAMFGAVVSALMMIAFF